MRGDSGVADEGRVAGIPNFHSWGKYTMPLTNINYTAISYFRIFFCAGLTLRMRILSIIAAQNR